MTIKKKLPVWTPQPKALETALKYANDVISGAILAGKYVKLAAKRFLEDLEHGHERNLFFDTKDAQHAVDFFGYLRHSKGEWGRGGGQPFVLEPWQVFIIANLFGWKMGREEDPENPGEWLYGPRRFLEAYVEVARKNGKSTLEAGIGLYMLVADGEPGAEVYSAATTRDQAKIIFDEADRMVSKSPKLKSLVQQSARAEKYRTNMAVVATASKFEPLSSEDDTLDGLNIHCGLLDELHAHPDRKLYDVLHEATMARKQALIAAITTAGYNRGSIGWTQHERCEKILEGVTGFENGDRLFAYIAAIDREDKVNNIPADRWDDEKCWIKANPNLGVSVNLDKLRAKCAAAKEDATAVNSFLCKHLNCWTSQEVRAINPEKWAACCVAGRFANPQELRAEALVALRGRLCFGALDISSKIDLSCFLLLFPPVPPRTARKPGTNELIEIPGDPLYRILPWFWMPEDNIPERVRNDRVEYDVWQRAGFLQTTPGNVIDQEFIRAEILKARSYFRIVDVGFDSWNNTQLSLQLEQSGLTMVDVRQGFRTLSEPFKEMQGLITSGRFEHYNNPVLKWNMSNLASTQDPAGNIKPDKAKSKEKIDGAVCLIMALSRVVANPGVRQNTDPSRGSINFL